MTRKPKYTKRILLPVAAAVVVMAVVIASAVYKPRPGYAACETPPSAVASIVAWVADSINNIQSFRDNYSDFMQGDIETGQDEMDTRITQFDENMREGMAQWWNDAMLPAMKRQTAQLNTATIDQTRMLGSQADARQQNEQIQKLQERESEARKRMQPSEFACQADTSYPKMGRQENLSEALTRGYANSAASRATAATGTPEALGPVAVTNDKWNTYTNLYCDSDANGGMAGCETDGAMPNADITMGSGLLWGDTMTLDLSIPANQQLYTDMMRNFVDQEPPQAMNPATLNTPQGVRQFNLSRANAARKQTINSVMGKMLSDHAAAPIDQASPAIREIRTQAGIPEDAASIVPAKAEIMQALAVERYSTPDFATKLVNNPSALQRGSLDSKSLHLQQMTQMQKNMDKLAVMLASEYAYDIEQKNAPITLAMAPTVSDSNYQPPESSYRPVDPDAVDSCVIAPTSPYDGPGIPPPDGGSGGGPGTPTASGFECNAPSDTGMNNASSYSMSGEGLDMLSFWEGMSLEVYYDSAGLATIGVGHLIKPGEDFSGGITEQQAMDLLAQDVQTAERAVRNAVKVPITQAQYDTLVSFAFNAGNGALYNSTMLRKLNNGDYEGARQELSKWNKATVNGQKQVIQGLVNRRDGEMNYYSGCTG